MFKTTLLKVNISHLRGRVHNNYMSVRDRYTKALLVGITMNAKAGKLSTINIFFENEKFNTLLDSYMRHRDLESLLSEVGNDAVSAFIETQSLIEEYVDKHYSDKHRNIYNITINSKMELVITNKWLKL